MKAFALPLLLASIIPMMGWAQSADGPRTGSISTYFEAGGNAILYSLNADYFATERISLRMGASYFAIHLELFGGSWEADWALFPFMASYLPGKGSSRPELGIGLLTGFIDDSEHERSPVLVPTAVIGYRYQRPGRLLVRVGYTPLILRGALSVEGSTVFAGSFGLSIGYALRGRSGITLRSSGPNAGGH